MTTAAYCTYSYETVLAELREADRLLLRGAELKATLVEEFYFLQGVPD